MTNKSKGSKLIGLGLLILIGAMLVFFFGHMKAQNYIKNGEKTDCVVFFLTNGGKKNHPVVVYTKDNGDPGFANIIGNKKVKLDQQLTVYILPEDPDNCYYPYDKKMAVLFVGGAGILSLVLVVTGVIKLKKG